jgi:FAD/FMN-containing dehydrogenase
MNERTAEATTLASVDPLLVEALEEIGAAVGVRATDRLAAAHDASHYLLTPRAVVTARTAADVAAVFRAAKAQGAPVTFRSGGTSLSGQAGSDGVLIDTRHHFRGIEVLDDGARVRVQPGATVRATNTRLVRRKRKLGPDPASEIACTIGGVVANNSSGMSCGTHANTYRTLESAILVLPSGTVVDTGAADADERLRAAEPRLVDGLERIRERVRRNPQSVATLTRLHAIKNTMGYGLNSFLDFDEPVKILEHLVIGSEGTLAFVAEATFRTVPILSQVSTGLLVFANLADATAALPALVEAGLATVELLDAASLRVAQRDHEAPDDLRALEVIDHAALLVEFQEATPGDLIAREKAAAGLFERLPLTSAAAMTTDPVTRAQLWHIRKGLFTTVAEARPSGTNALLEDIAVPVERLGETCERLIELFDKHGYEGSVIFGHAKDGNIHFLVNERFDDAKNLARYEAFTEEMVDLVLAQGGTLKAEHGTGRIMAPFVNRQYGDELYEVMWEVKRLVDPEGLLNPGVLLTEDPLAYTRDLKTAPTVEDEVDRCVECGYCEPACPSKDVTLTPRQRIVLRREMERAAREDPREGVRLRRDRHLRRRRNVPDRVSGADQYGRPRAAAPQGEPERGHAGRLEPRREALGRDQRHRWQGAVLRARAADRAPEARDPGGAGGSRIGHGAAVHRRPAGRRIPPAARHGRESGGDLLLVLHDDDVRPRRRRRCCAVVPAAVRARGRAGVDARRPALALLRNPVEIEGAVAGLRRDDRAGRLVAPARDRQRTPARRMRCVELHGGARGAASGGGGARDPGTRRGRVRRRADPAAPAGGPEGGIGHRASDVLIGPSGYRRRADARRRCGRRRGRRAG